MLLPNRVRYTDRILSSTQPSFILSLCDDSILSFPMGFFSFLISESTILPLFYPITWSGPSIYALSRFPIYSFGREFQYTLFTVPSFIQLVENRMLLSLGKLCSLFSIFACLVGAQYNGPAPPRNSTSASSNQTTTNPSYWLQDIKHQGVSSFQTNSSYLVFRNVEDYGAKGRRKFIHDYRRTLTG